MGIIEIILLAAALSMDAFAVSICKGLALDRITFARAAYVGAWFGVFQAGMPLLGYFLGSSFASYITACDHWIAFALLAVIGGNMIRESRSKCEECADASLSFKNMLLLAVATSIDALAIGVTLSMDKPVTGIWIAVAIIGVLTFSISAVGVKIGNIFGSKYEKKAELAGGCVLILIGLKILIEGIIETGAAA